MKPTPVIAIFDVGKTNKKIILFDKKYRLLQEEAVQFEEIKDDNGEACDDIESITRWVNDTIASLQKKQDVNIKAFNVSAYGASFVYLDANFRVLTPLYNYLNPYPSALQQKFYNDYGGELALSMQTASPVLGNLNSGLQLYLIKYERPSLFNSIEYALHLPQYISHVITSMTCSEITSIGCHTHLWDFGKGNYHDWVSREGLGQKLPAIQKSDSVLRIHPRHKAGPIPAGTGLHDSSSAIIPYLMSFHEPFVLLSTGTWCISLNPFNAFPLTEEELKKDCLCYLSYEGKPVKASRLFSGNDHEIQSKRIAQHFSKPKEFFKTTIYDHALIHSLSISAAMEQLRRPFTRGAETSAFKDRDLSTFASYEAAYHQLMIDIMYMQTASTELVLKNTSVKRVFVDGGFSKNSIYMNLLASAFPTMEVFGATIPQSTAMGAALAIHSHWNSLPVPRDIIQLKYYARPPQ